MRCRLTEVQTDAKYMGLMNSVMGNHALKIMIALAAAAALSFRSTFADACLSPVTFCVLESLSHPSHRQSPPAFQLLNKQLKTCTRYRTASITWRKFSSQGAFKCPKMHSNVVRMDRKNFVTALFALRDLHVSLAAVQPLALLSRTIASLLSWKSAPLLVSLTDLRATFALSIQQVLRKKILQILLSLSLM